MPESNPVVGLGRLNRPLNIVFCGWLGVFMWVPALLLADGWLEWAAITVVGVLVELRFAQLTRLMAAINDIVKPAVDQIRSEVGDV